MRYLILTLALVLPALATPDGALADLDAKLAAYAAEWINTTWDEKALPATPRGDPVALAKMFLAKYPM